MNIEQLLVLTAIVNSASMVDIMEACDEAKRQGPWMPASNGSEEVFLTRSGRRLLYCWQQTTGQHAYLDVDTDLLLTEEEARMHLDTY
jgi:hypothetical protein